MNEEIIARAAEIISKKCGGGNAGYCTLALIDTDGYPTAATISVSKAESIKWLTFCSGLNSNWVKRIKKCNRASVCFNSEEYNITLVGTIEVLTDPPVKNEMWYEGMGEHFSGPEDPNYCVIRFTTERYSLLVDWKGAVGKI